MGSVDHKSYSFLDGKLLIATPIIHESCFEKAVIYVCSHNEDGAMGVLVNNVLSDISCSDILEQLNINDVVRTLPPIHFGGPVDSSRGFILHTNDYITEATLTVDSNISLTATVDMLEDIIAGKGPDKSIIALGYAGWGPGQLEEEIMANSWITAPASEELIFSLDNSKKWSQSAKNLGIDLLKYSTVVGHA